MIELATKRGMMMKILFKKMVFMRLIKADKLLAERIQKKIKFQQLSNALP